MTVGGKREGITAGDLLVLAEEMNIRQARDVIAEVGAAVRRWPEFAAEAGVAEESMVGIGAAQVGL